MTPDSKSVQTAPMSLVPVPPEVHRLIGQTLNGKWHVDSVIAVGGMAAVYRATHRNGKRAAIKAMLPCAQELPGAQERFLREGYLANKLGHPNALSVLDDDTTEDGTVYLVMELLEGRDLDALMQRKGGTLDVATVLAVAEQTLDVLVAAHAQSVVHRDIKPGNLFLTRDGQVKVLDFGLARCLDAAPTRLTAAGTVLGTVAYMAPEQARGMRSAIDHRADIFAVGAVMYRALTGRSVHEGQTQPERLLSAMTKPPAPIRTHTPSMPRIVAEAIDRAVAFSPTDRWQSPGEMQDAVRMAFDALFPGDEPRRVTLTEANKAAEQDEVSVPEMSRLPEVAAELVSVAIDWEED